MNSVDKFLQAIKSDELLVTGTKIGEQAFLISKINSPTFFVVGDNESAFKAQEQLISLGKKCLILDNPNNPYLITKFQSQDSKLKLLDVMYQMAKSTLDVVVLTPQAIMLKVGDLKKFKSKIINFKVNSNIDVVNLSTNLTNIGFNKVDAVQQVGDFSIRGEVVDIFAPNHAYPIRLNLFDDLIENIIYFDSINLTTISKLEQADICPMQDVFLSEDDKSLCEKELSKWADKYKENSIYDLLSNFELNKTLSNEYLEKVGIKLYSILDCNTDARVVISNPLHIQTQLEQYVDEVSKTLDSQFKNEELKQILKPNFSVKFKDRKLVVFDSLGNYKCKNILDLPTKNLSSYLYKADLIKFELASIRHKQIQLCLDNEYTLNSIKSILTSNSVGFSLNLKDEGIVLTTNKLPLNVCFTDDDVWYIGSGNFAHKKVVESSARAKIKFLPKAGEYVVHEIHGIGLCQGVVTLKVMGADKDFFKIVYKDNDVLYVPTENTDSLSLYMSESSQVHLNKLGGKEFALNKAKAKIAIEDMAKELLVLYSKRQQAKGYKYQEDNYLCTEFDNAFEYTETADQMQAINDIKHDMTSGKVMDRLICGDVGYGKTEVAMRAVFKAVVEGKQVAVLAPTTILSLQHYMTFCKRFKNFDVRIEMLNRFKTNKQKENIIKGLKDGTVDIVCGTHSLVADNIGFKDLGLLILDEEQRFGVQAKEKLKSIKTDVDVITMSATPIPRTLNMALLTLRDISIINTPPQNRLPVKTYVIPYDENVIAQAISNEVDRGGQVLVVYNDISKIFHLASTLKNILGDKINLDVAHGKMTRVALENAVKRLYDKETNVFVSTTLIENGVDLPGANTLIVLDSQNLGLSQMYQLRGRVGRSNTQAYAYFTYPKGKTLTIEASERLEALAENTELGSGFKIAMRDLQLRGAGELLGKSQHGHMIKLGYDMYVKLLEETTKRLLGKEVEQVKEVKLDIAINARIPNNFVDDEVEKLKIYSKISNIVDEKSQKEIVEELKSSYSRLPKEVVQLCNVALIKALSQKLGVKHIVIDKENMFVEFYQDSVTLEQLLQDMSKFNKFSLKKSTLPTIKLNSNEFSPDTAQGYIIGYLNFKCKQL